MKILAKKFKRKIPKKFKRQEWYALKSLGEKWRKPRGTHSKMKRRMSGKPKMPSIGFRKPAGLRNLHPSGYREVMVIRPEDLAKIKQNEAVRISAAVGSRLRDEIRKKATELKLKILN